MTIRAIQVGVDRKEPLTWIEVGGSTGMREIVSIKEVYRGHAFGTWCEVYMDDSKLYMRVSIEYVVGIYYK